jgi:hypothetical protein
VESARGTVEAHGIQEVEGSTPFGSTSPFLTRAGEAQPSLGRRVHELRLKDRSGAYRVVYALVRRGTVHVLHAFKKTMQATPFKNVDLARKRLKEVLS